ncbi:MULTISPECIES: glycosyltransferase family 4 protein [unclassified Paraburkholderia]|uniref:glycosyltransferase family 4 protein n=1 Tax=unclassified Paraburkholderia TaxID=2615204 RepID=UPI00161BE645|nr:MULTISPECIES: glycosyltransferase family 4 protein [unclassified Paraburkholderia]MBB5445181.1 rhamnosyl/mannosyltransferase [Paraburkholderia sp. WSM4177]MBB5485729.1 rhamnosyl/mannosyltransferase [Paraburkholderia sp. WSM4180]
MRVLHFYKTYKPDSMGGVEELIGQICSGAARQGVTSDVLTVSKDTTTIDFGDHLHHRAKLDIEIASSAFSMAAFKKFSRLAAHADLIHYHFPWPFADIVHFATGVDKPSVVTYHSDIIRQKVLLQVYKPLRDRFLSSVDAIVATSPNYLATSDVLQRYRDKVEVIPIGLDRDSYAPPREDRLRYWRERVGDKFFLFVGNLRYYKGLHVLLDALQRTEVRVVIVGAGPVERELRAQAARLALAHVDFVGPVADDDKIALLTLCRALMFPSHLRSEAFGISLLEGAMFGKPMISTEIGTGTSYVNVDGETGLVVPPSDPAALRDAMQRLWDDDAMVTEFGIAAAKRFTANFTAEKMVRSYVDLYEKLVS